MPRRTCRLSPERWREPFSCGRQMDTVQDRFAMSMVVDDLEESLRKKERRDDCYAVRNRGASILARTNKFVHTLFNFSFCS